ncbi:MAG TPA: hypothetical protein VLG38_03825 [Gammaproteobacteria bacterium]|nr:hypothetical protein [Gammaproteobacteria bacterium]
MLRRRLESTAPATNLQSTEHTKRARVTTTTSSTVAQAYALTVAQQISQMPSLDAATSSSSSNASNTSIASTSPSTEDWLDERKKILPPEYGLTIDDLNKIRQNAIHEINRFKEIFDELNQTRLYELITHNEPRLKHAIAEWRAATAKFSFVHLTNPLSMAM